MGKSQRLSTGRLGVDEGTGRNGFVQSRTVILIRTNYSCGLETGLYLFRFSGVREHC